MIELIFICMLIGFVGGYFSSQWVWTNKVAALLDKVFKKNEEKK
jgi:hypothetical protein